MPCLNKKLQNLTDPETRRCIKYLDAESLADSRGCVRIDFLRIFSSLEHRSPCMIFTMQEM
jgi:hypothetical protein